MQFENSHSALLHFSFVKGVQFTNRNVGQCCQGITHCQRQCFSVPLTVMSGINTLKNIGVEVNEGAINYLH